MLQRSLLALLVATTLIACSDSDTVRNTVLTSANIGGMDATVQASSLPPHEKEIFHQLLVQGKLSLGQTVRDNIEPILQQEQSQNDATALSQAAANAKAADTARLAHALRFELLGITIDATPNPYTNGTPVHYQMRRKAPAFRPGI